MRRLIPTLLALTLAALLCAPAASAQVRAACAGAAGVELARAGADTEISGAQTGATRASSGAACPAAQASTVQDLATAGADWKHTLQGVANLRAGPPGKPLVVMFGSSIVRESITSDKSWAAEIKRRGGGSVAAYDVGSPNQSFAQDLALVAKLPSVPTIVIIGVDVARFPIAPATPTITLPSPAAIPSSYDSHRYSSSRIKSLAKKQALVKDWLTRRYPVFKEYYAYNLRQLRKLVQACKDKGLHPVLLDTPRNTAVIKSAWKTPVNLYRASCKALAKKTGVPFVDMVAKARFVNTDFYDLLHAVQSGRVKWQRLLSIKTVALLKQYGMR